MSPGTVLLSVFAGVVLVVTWLVLSLFLPNELVATLVFLPFLAAQALLLHILHKTKPILWSVASTAIAVVVAIPVAVALDDPRMLFNWVEWTVWVPEVVWAISPFLVAFIIVPPLCAHLLGRWRSHNRWRGP